MGSFRPRAAPVSRSLAALLLAAASCVSVIAPPPDAGDAATRPAEASTPVDLGPGVRGTPESRMPCVPGAETAPPPGNACRPGAQANCDVYGNTVSRVGRSYTHCTTTDCVKADRCGDIADVSSCRCGREPACMIGEACVAEPPDAEPRCRCIAR